MDSMTSPTEPARRRFGLSLVGLARRWRRTLDDRLAAAGLTDATWAPLVHLQEHGDGICQKDLAALVGLDGSSLVRLLDILAAQEMIERRPDENDRRAKRIFLTDAGRRAVATIRKRLTVIEDEMMVDLDDEGIAAMLTAFERIEARLQRMRDDRDQPT